VYQRRTPTLGPGQFLRDTHRSIPLIPEAATQALTQLLRQLPVQVQHNQAHPVTILTRVLSNAPAAAQRGLTNALSQVAAPRQLPTTASGSAGSVRQLPDLPTAYRKISPTVPAPNNLPPVAGRTIARQVVYPANLPTVPTNKPYHR
jgi:hypothetical protein